MSRDDRSKEEYSELVSGLRETLEMGSAAHQFFNTRIGRYLLKKASDEEEQAFRDYLELEAEDAKAIRLNQEQARIPKLVFAWLRDAITEAAGADQQIAIELEEMSHE